MTTYCKVDNHKFCKKIQKIQSIICYKKTVGNFLFLAKTFTSVTSPVTGSCLLVTASSIRVACALILTEKNWSF